ncbi:MAG: tRNA pseudouridine(13) synthase TruD, partial [Myxococcales bacterium]
MGYDLPVKIKQRPEDFVVREGFRFEEDPEGPVFVYRMDKQKVSTLQALERISKDFAVRRRDLSICGLKDKQGRTEQLVGVLGGALGESEVVQSGDLRLKLIGRAAEPLSSRNITANRFEVTVRDLAPDEADRVSESAAEVERTGVVNYFDSQRFGFLKHGQGFIAKHLLRGDWEAALKAFLATPS